MVLSKQQRRARGEETLNVRTATNKTYKKNYDILGEWFCILNEDLKKKHASIWEKFWLVSVFLLCKRESVSIRAIDPDKRRRGMRVLNPIALKLEGKNRGRGGAKKERQG